MTIRVKQVISRMMDGASVSSVMIPRTLMALSASLPSFTPFKPMLRLKEPALVCADAAVAPPSSASSARTGK